ncbi:MAG: hypothetical protein EXS24_06560 [Pedosphaera sp.]|nr:hypothetical protein [Pedosphaera sp.]
MRFLPLIVGVSALFFSAQTSFAQRASIKPKMGKGHPLRKDPTLKPFNYQNTPEPTDPAQRAFSSALPGVHVLAGTTRNGEFGDFYVDPAVTLNNSRRPANAYWDAAAGRWVDPSGQWVWMDPNNPIYWISTRSMRIHVRAPFKTPQ